MSTIRAAAALAISACALAAAACGETRTRQPATTHPSALALAQVTHEYPSPAPKPQTASAPAASPTAAIRAFVTEYINWDAQTVSADLRMLAGRSVGQARSAMALAAAETAGDYELQRGGI